MYKVSLPLTVYCTYFLLFLIICTIQPLTSSYFVHNPFFPASFVQSRFSFHPVLYTRLPFHCICTKMRKEGLDGPPHKLHFHFVVGHAKYGLAVHLKCTGLIKGNFHLMAFEHFYVLGVGYMLALKYSRENDERMNLA